MLGIKTIPKLSDISISKPQQSPITQHASGLAPIFTVHVFDAEKNTRLNIPNTVCNQQSVREDNWQYFKVVYRYLKSVSLSNFHLIGFPPNSVRGLGLPF